MSKIQTSEVRKFELANRLHQSYKALYRLLVLLMSCKEVLRNLRRRPTTLHYIARKMNFFHQWENLQNVVYVRPLHTAGNAYEAKAQQTAKSRENTT